LKDVSILPVRMNAGIDVLFGNLGQDFVAGVESFSLDFSTMTFSLGRAAENAETVTLQPVIPLCSPDELRAGSQSERDVRF